MPKISIVVPVYNVEKNILNTVKSIQKQTLREIEIILVNDGSTDKSGELCDNVAASDDRIKVIHQKNQGVSIARNNGMNIAKGDYIVFSDADDLMSEDMCEILLKNAINYKADLSMVSQVTKTLRGKEEFFNNSKKKYLWNKEEGLENFFKGDVFTISACAKLIRKDLADKVRFAEGFAVHEDKFFVYETIKNAHRIYYEDICKYIYIKRKNSASTSRFSKKKFDAVYLANRMLNDIKLTENEELIKKAYVDACKTKLMILRGIYRDRDAKKAFRNEKKDLINEIKTINLKEYGNLFPKQKLIEILIIKKITIFYGIVVRIYDKIFK